LTDCISKEAVANSLEDIQVLEAVDDLENMERINLMGLIQKVTKNLALILAE